MRYFFYPFDDTAGLDLMDGLTASMTAPATLAHPAIGLIYRDDGTWQTTFSQVAITDSIFVVGHTASGQKVIASHADKAIRIDQTGIVERLIQCGLRSAVACRIVIYACESASGDTASLAAKVASSLLTNNFACSGNVYGFKGKVSTTPHKGSLCIEVNGGWVSVEDPDTEQLYYKHSAPYHHA
ncbi:hypothetical protein HX890_25630 [Pseudomonas gingeri]|uniref:hypothetical protein n=1 Tax=Pseudomonas gingeri TaxID=117681 RepID=UPI0015A37A46|nr:hypothetical protein [Pseudomonas gingeri]NWD77509.1 hypothetical protein [Pseudomonas gingeri]